MINRILIRVKVVQMLYSYLLTHSEFHIDAAPEAASADRRFAYSVYLDLLLAIAELSGVRTAGARGNQGISVDKLLRHNKVGGALAATDELKTVLSRGTSHIDQLRPLLQEVADAITASEIFKDYKKIKNPTPADDARFWSVVLETVVLKNTAVVSAFRAMPEFTGRGLDMGLDAAKASLASFGDSRQAYLSAKTDLQRSLDKAYDLYFGIFELMVELTREQRKRLEAAKEKYVPTAEDLNPQTRFVDNAFIARLEADEVFAERMEKQPSLWSDDLVLVPRLLNTILSSDIYKRYMEAPSTDYAADCDFWREVCKSIILPGDDLAEAMESRSVFWNDDMQVMGTFVLKSLRQMAGVEEGKPLPFLPQFKDSEDASFGSELFTLAVEHKDEYQSYINKFINTEHWDAERMAFMDVVIMTCAIAELINYPSIPVPVTMNEYVEIANNYSTQRSGQFVNGVLYAVCEYLRSEGKINK
ncbi:MAG: transcription antitermination protein NusB [Muribaculaceae bacterium]|nr:transcription antitermination protein NusB [Muribaculaceae bacterium]